MSGANGCQFIKTQRMNEYCNLTSEEIRSISPDLSKMYPVRIDERTIVYIKRAKDAEKARSKWLKIIAENRKKIN